MYGIRGPVVDIAATAHKTLYVFTTVCLKHVVIVYMSNGAHDGIKRAASLVTCDGVYINVQTYVIFRLIQESRTVHTYKISVWSNDGPFNHSQWSGGEYYYSILAVGNHIVHKHIVLLGDSPYYVHMHYTCYYSIMQCVLSSCFIMSEVKHNC